MLDNSARSDQAPPTQEADAPSKGARSLLKETKARLLGLGESQDEGAPGPLEPTLEPAAGNEAAELRHLAIEDIRPDAQQPRRQYDPEALAALAETIKEKGLLQPLVVRPDQGDPGKYEIIAGERRWRAAQLAGLDQVLAQIRRLSDREAYEVSLVENIQREDLAPLDLAEAYQRLINDFGHTQDSLARAVGKSRSAVANTLRLLNLPPPIRSMIQSRQLSPGHARVLIGAPEAEGLAKRVVDKGLSVRQTEALVRDPAAAGQAPHAKLQSVAEPRLSAALDRPVTVSYDGALCRLTVHCEGAEDLSQVIARLETALSGAPATAARPAPLVAVAASQAPAASPERRRAAPSRQYSKDDFNSLAAQLGYPPPYPGPAEDDGPAESQAS